jgi:hypothetical protein
MRQAARVVVDHRLVAEVHNVERAIRADAVHRTNQRLLLRMNSSARDRVRDAPYT